MYLGRYRTGKVKTRLSLEGWQNLPAFVSPIHLYRGLWQADHHCLQKKQAVVETMAALTPNGHPSAVRSAYEDGRYKLVLVPLLCGYYDMAVQNSAFSLSVWNPGVTRLRRGAAVNPGNYGKE